MIKRQTVEQLMDLLRADLRKARKDHDRIRLQTLQALIARIDNAAAVPNMETETPNVSQFFAGAKEGLGSTEVARKVLSVEDIKQAIADEKAEILAALEEYADDPENGHALDLRKKLAILAEEAHGCKS